MPQMKALDAIDRHILKLVQADASLPIGVIAHKVGLSQTPCWKRLQRLEAEGFIRSRVALLAAEKLGLGLSVIVTIEIGEHSDEQLERLSKSVAAMPEVLDFLRLAGDTDYLLRVLVSDTVAFDKFYKRLLALAPMKKVTSRFVLETIKATTEIPIET